jgi:hypothetical protein
MLLCFPYSHHFCQGSCLGTPSPYASTALSVLGIPFCLEDGDNTSTFLLDTDAHGIILEDSNLHPFLLVYRFLLYVRKRAV